MEAKTRKESDEEIIYIFTYLLMWLSGIVVYFTLGQRNRRLKFHAVQSIFLGVVTFVLAYIPYIGVFAAILWLYGIYIGIGGYKGKDMEIPVLGKLARKYSK
jgi:uncharacterized membrane protein